MQQMETSQEQESEKSKYMWAITRWWTSVWTFGLNRSFGLLCFKLAEPWLSAEVYYGKTGRNLGNVRDFSDDADTPWQEYHSCRLPSRVLLLAWRKWSQVSFCNLGPPPHTRDVLGWGLTLNSSRNTQKLLTVWTQAPGSHSSQPLKP